MRVAEEYGLVISYDPKIFKEWNGSGCHTNFSTETMRAGTGGMKYIDDMMTKFSAKHKLHISLFTIPGYPKEAPTDADKNRMPVKN